MSQIVIDQALIERYQSALEMSLQQQSELTRKLEALNQQAAEDKLLTIDEACAYLGKSADTLLYYRRHGLEFYSKGKKGVWYRKRDIDKWLDSGKVQLHN